ncbi:uncharacterized protein LOC112046805 [Bicyclus anynana]|uniref:Uncharacterized protein LOC112046805 n=1 Tax=Bicyclus anynana TaxID=110368 RepID=A0ABM3M679_BICAN|nr:uncharacterized protein LOC112046805 [Bicyclus anynana]
MQCAKLRLLERSKSKTKIPIEKSGRFCQKRLVNPDHDEDARWTDVSERFYCNNMENNDLNQTHESGMTLQSREDICLSVQNIQFQGSIEQRRRPRTSFKYKTLPDGQKHRMFVKEMVDEFESEEANRYSELSDYFDDYSKYFSNNDNSRPSSGKSSIVLYCLNNKTKENKATQVDLRSTEPRRKHKLDLKIKKVNKRIDKLELLGDSKNNIEDKKDDNIDDTKITFHKNGKRKSLTISRTESPATVQVIRVDVVCNYSTSSTMSDYEENRSPSGSNDTKETDQETKTTNLKKSRFVNKYMLTNTVKTLDQNVSGGKVTLMCKTFKLTNRSKFVTDNNTKAVK